MREKDNWIPISSIKLGRGGFAASEGGKVSNVTIVILLTDMAAWIPWQLWKYLLPKAVRLELP